MLTDFPAIGAGGQDQVACLHRARRGVQPIEFSALRVFAVGKAQSTTFVGFADQSQAGDAFGLAKAIAALDQLQHGVVL